MTLRRARSVWYSTLAVGSSAALLVWSCGGSEASKKPFPAGEGGEAGEAPVHAGGSSGHAGASGHGGTSVASAGEGGAAEGGAAGVSVGNESGAGGVITPEGGAAGAGEAGEAGAAGAPSTACGAPSTGNITIAFAAADAEHVTKLQWKTSSGALSPTVIGEGGPAHCADPQEFFGQSYGAPEGTQPLPVVGGNLATLATCGSDITITSAAMTCENPAPQQAVTTQYHFYGDARKNEMRVTRTFAFDSSTQVYVGTTGLRPYVPRVALGVLPNVIYPNQTGTAVTTVPATNCGGDCFVPVGASWSGKWFADVDPTSGLALIVLRDPAMTSAVDLTVNYDAYSNANLASFVLLQPAEGWKTTISETEYLCFADLTTWPQTQRDAAVLPAGCGP